MYMMSEWHNQRLQTNSLFPEKEALEHRQRHTLKSKNTLIRGVPTCTQIRMCVQLDTASIGYLSYGKQ